MSQLLKSPGSAGPRSAHGLVIDTLRLYSSYPLLFLTLAATVIVPYELVVLAITGAGPFEQGTLDLTASLALTLTDLALVGPLVSALHVHAVREVREGGEPKLAPVARQGLKVLPVVAAVSIMSWLGILAGIIALIAPGIYLMLRWFVVAQAAAVDNEGWLTALRRGSDLTEGHYGRVFGFAIYIGLIASVPVFLVGLGFGASTGAVAFLVAVLVQVLAYSFGALATALFYFDLRTRWEVAASRQVEQEPAPRHDPSPPEQSSLDPRNHAIEDRPKGWYVDPGNPARMRYWEAGDPPRWSTATTRTPSKIREAWEAKERDQ